MFNLRRLALILMVTQMACFDQATSAQIEVPEFLELTDGGKIAGRLEIRGDGTAQFVETKAKAVTNLEPGMTVRFDGKGQDNAAGLPPYRIDLGLGQRLCGRLGSVTDQAITLLDTTGSNARKIIRSGAHSLIQRAGETLVFQDGFESAENRRWSVTGEPGLSDTIRISGDHSLILPANGCSLTHRLKEPFVSGRLEVAFHDQGTKIEGRQWFVDLTFRGPTGPETVRAILGWNEESLAVESPTGPALAVQRLGRKVGWHRLSIRFGKELTEIAVDGNELAHGKGFGGPLVEVRLATYVKDSPDKTATEKLVGHMDDLRLIKFSEPVGGLEIDVTQDEVRLIGGDQIFGSVKDADGERVKIMVDGRATSISWGEITGVFFRRGSVPAAPIEGWLVRAEWRTTSGDDSLDFSMIEGALAAVSADAIRLNVPYAGAINISREQMVSLKILGRARRIVVDPMAHHLGDEISSLPPILDPPQPEGGILERSFELAKIPEGSAFLVLDVVQVVGEQADIPTFSDMIKRGELRTNVKINGEPFDYLNRYVKDRNDSPERIRIPIPREHLRPGKNVVRFEQGGTANDPNYLDDLGVLCIAIEFSIPRGPSAATPP